MLTLVLSLTLGAVVFAGVTALMGTLAAYVPALAAAIAAWILITRRVGRRVEAMTATIEKHVTAGRVEAAIKALEELRPLGRWQFLFARSLDGQIGSLLYAHRKEFDRARPYLERAHVKVWPARAMLGADHYRRRRYDDMQRVFDHATRHNKKTALLWAAWAWCEWKRGQRDQAISILGRARKHLPNDALIQKNLQALQNLKGMKMNGYRAEWLALHLEKPPAPKQRFMPAR